MKAELGFEFGTTRAQSQAFPTGPCCLLWAMSGFWEEHLCFFLYQQESGRKTEITAEFLQRKFNISIYIKQKNLEKRTIESSFHLLGRGWGTRV